MAEESRRELSFPLMPHGEIEPKLEDYLRQLEELLRTLFFGLEAPGFPDPDDQESTFTEGSVIFAGASGGLTEDNTNFFYTLASTLLTVAFLSLGGANGSVWYSWDGKLVELPTAAHGMVLHDGGGIVPPYWDWVVLRTTELFIDAMVSSSVVRTRYETLDETSDQAAALIQHESGSNLGANPTWFDSNDFSVTAADASAKLTFDETSDQGAAAVGSEIVTAVA
jgi:hypothetical protein